MKKVIVIVLILAMALTVLVGCGGTGDLKSGIGVVNVISGSSDATAEEDGTGYSYVTIAAVTVDKDGKIVTCSLDALQSRINFDSEGMITSDLDAPAGTKVQAGDDYGMKDASEIGKEWYEQADAFADWAVGKTIDEVMDLPTYEKDERHPTVPDTEDLKASVTIDVGHFLHAIEMAVEMAK